MCDITEPLAMFTAGSSLEGVLERADLIPVIAIVVGSVIAVVSIVLSSVRSMVVNRNREQTKRELAAYVAEGSLDPDKAIAMMNAGRSGSGGCGEKA